MLFSPYNDPVRQVVPRPVYSRGKPEESNPNAHLPFQISRHSRITLILSPRFTRTSLFCTNVLVLFLIQPGHVTSSSRVPSPSSWLWQFLRLGLFSMTLSVLRSSSQVGWDLGDVFLMSRLGLRCRGEKPRGHFHHVLPRARAMAWLSALRGSPSLLCSEEGHH